MNPRERTSLLARLSGYEWVEIEHRVMYDAIARCREMEPAAMRAELQSVSTRLGFPDLDLTEYLREDNGADVTAEDSARSLESLLGKRITGKE